LLALDKIPRSNYRTYEKSVYDLFKKNYMDDPLSPPGGTHLKDLRIAVAEALGLDEAEEKNLKAYSAVGTVIDFKFGTDGFMEYTNLKTGKTDRVTIDVTLNTRKADEVEHIKADVLVGELPDAVQDEDAFLEAIDKKGGEIAALLMKRTAPEDMRRAA
jgi:hypothetical protein